MSAKLTSSGTLTVPQFHPTIEWRAIKSIAALPLWTAALVIAGIPKFLHVQTSCPYLVWETEREVRGDVKWTGSKPACTKQSHRQTDLLTTVPTTTTPHDPLHDLPPDIHKRTQDPVCCVHHERTCSGYYSPVCQCVFFLSVSLSVTAKKREAVSHVIQMFQSPASQRPTVARLKRGSLWRPDRWL